MKILLPALYKSAVMVTTDFHRQQRYVSINVALLRETTHQMRPVPILDCFIHSDTSGGLWPGRMVGIGIATHSRPPEVSLQFWGQSKSISSSCEVKNDVLFESVSLG